MRKISALIMSVAMLLSVASCGNNNETASSQESAVPTSVTVEYLAKDGSQLATNTGETSAGLNGDFIPESGTKVRVSVTGTKYVALECFGLPKSIIYTPDGSFEFTVPEKDPQRDYPTNTFGKGFTLSASVPTAEELKAERNLALNPYDLKDSNDFPHALANNEYNGSRDPDFWARNAIDGFSQNTGHGRYPYQSWGPDRISGLEYTVDLGRECKVSSVTIHVRADFPHDISWSSCDIVDDDGNVIKSVTFKQVAEGQTFTFDSPVTTSKIVFKNMVSPDNNKWSGFTEIAVTGTEIA